MESSTEEEEAEGEEDEEQLDPRIQVLRGDEEWLLTRQLIRKHFSNFGGRRCHCQQKIH